MKEMNRYIDHTNLKPDAVPADIERLCQEASVYQFASVCVHPCYIALAKELLAGSGVKVCTVIGFPLGANTSDTKVRETQNAFQLGCDEFDMVIHIGALKDGNIPYVEEEIKGVVQAAQGRTVKVIIETGLLTDAEKVLATQIVCRSGAQFVKTCTGFSGGGATVEDVKLIKQHLSNDVKIKASAGIKTYHQAVQLIEAGAQRIGTSAGVQIMQK